MHLLDAIHDILAVIRVRKQWQALRDRDADTACDCQWAFAQADVLISTALSVMLFTRVSGDHCAAGRGAAVPHLQHGKALDHQVGAPGALDVCLQDFSTAFPVACWGLPGHLLLFGTLLHSCHCLRALQSISATDTAQTTSPCCLTLAPQPVVIHMARCACIPEVCWFLAPADYAFATAGCTVPSSAQLQMQTTFKHGLGQLRSMPLGLWCGLQPRQLWRRAAGA